MHDGDFFVPPEYEEWYATQKRKANSKLPPPPHIWLKTAQAERIKVDVVSRSRWDWYPKNKTFWCESCSSHIPKDQAQLAIDELKKDSRLQQRVPRNQVGICAYGRANIGGILFKFLTSIEPEPDCQIPMENRLIRANELRDSGDLVQATEP
jgi:hypothetical protein